MSAPAKQRSFPKIEFTDSEAGALEFPSSKSRKFNYYTPAKLRSTMYEDVTIDIQPDRNGISQGWITASAMDPAATRKDLDRGEILELACPCDPRGWEQTIYRNNAAVVRQVDLCLRNAKRARAYEGLEHVVAGSRTPRGVDARRERHGVAHCSPPSSGRPRRT
jgi:propane monooxygenase small subunit